MFGQTVADLISPLNPCDEALEWARATPTRRGPGPSARAGDWMLWVVGRLTPSALV